MEAGWTCTQCYCRECMKLSRLYSESYCCWSHSSPKLSSTDFMEVFPEVDDCSPFSAFSPLSSWNTFTDKGVQPNTGERCVHVLVENIKIWLLLEISNNSTNTRGQSCSHLVECEEVEELVCAHALQAGVLLAYNSVSDAHLELLQSHDLLLQRASCDQPVHVHHPFLQKTNGTY